MPYKVSQYMSSKGHASIVGKASWYGLGKLSKIE